MKKRENGRSPVGPRGAGAEAGVRDRIGTLIAQTNPTKFEDMLTDLIKGAFPGRPLQEVLEQEILPAILKQPEWVAENGGLKIGRGAVFNSGAFCVYYGKDPITGKLVGLLHRRKEKGPDDDRLRGAVGGYTTLPEQPTEGLIRETCQELCDDKGSIFTPDPKKYVLLHSGKDFHDGTESKSEDKLPIEYTAYAYELSLEEIEKLKTYTERLGKDDKYRETVKIASGRETYGASLLPLEDIVQMSPDQFKYHRHYDTFRHVAYVLGVEAPGLSQRKNREFTPFGPTIGDCVELNMTRRTHRDGVMRRYTPRHLEISSGEPPLKGEPLLGR